MANKLFNLPTAPTSITRAVVITPNDSTDLAFNTRMIYVGGTGHISLIPEGETSAVLFSNLAVGWHPIAASRIRSTGTTATLIVACA